MTRLDRDNIDTKIASLRENLKRLRKWARMGRSLHPDKTRVVSVQIYDYVEALEYAQAHWLAGGLLVFSFVVLLVLYSVQKRGRM